MAVTATFELNFDRKLEIVTAGLTKEHSNLLEKIPREDALTVMDYMISFKCRGKSFCQLQKGYHKMFDQIYNVLSQIIIFKRTN